jgi:carbohydrate kinase (thermoresistant glucokinase family)
MIKFLFGKAGSGKTHIGEAASRSYGFHFHDADQDLPEAFRQAIAAGGGVTEKMRQEYLEAMIVTIRRLASEHANVCVSQALFRDRMRLRILQAVPAVEFVWVDAPDDVLWARLEARGGHIASRPYAQMVNRLFEAPTVPHARFINDGNAVQFADQMKKIFGPRTWG